MIRSFALLLFLLLASESLAQVDTEFWFAPPEVTSGHGDRPIYLRISTLDQPANVRVIQPARGNYLLANVTVPANTTQTIDLTSNIYYLEPRTPAVVLTTGIHVISSAPITAYYEIGSVWNTDIFSLKGKNALGNKFVIPVQDLYDNGPYDPTPSFAFDIVATRNNTVVKIKPTKPLFGDAAGTEFIIKLNAGETYSCQKISTFASANPGGTVVESNKPIAITIKDDSLINGGCRDIIGDQLVPVEVAGTEYVVLKGFLQTNEYLFITAVYDGTEIFIGSNTIPIATLQAGKLFRLLITSPSTYVHANKTIYVMHVTGFGCELGMAILPSINCKGSTQIGFARTTTEFFGLNVLVRKEGISQFILNGSSALVPSTAFTAVPGTADKWYTAQLSFSTSQIPVNTASLITNSAYSFQIGIINGDAASTCRYGYFSAFSTLFIGDDFSMCEGETATLDAGSGKESYFWSTGANTQQIAISEPGTYWVRSENEECVLQDTIQINVKRGKVNLGPDQTFCIGDTIHVDGHENFSWQWSDGSSNQFLNTKEPGKYWVSVIDYVGCQASDTIILTTKPLPKVDLGGDVIKCPLEEATLNAFTSGATYAWQNGSSSPSVTSKEAGQYWCKVTYNGCSVTDFVFVKNKTAPPQHAIYGSSSVCPNSPEIEYRVDDIPDLTYDWFINGGVISQSNGSSVKVNWAGTNSSALVKTLITNSEGCQTDTLFFPVRINVKLVVDLPVGPDTLCFNKSDRIIYNTTPSNGSVYNWNITGGEIVDGQTTPQVIVNWQKGLNTLWIEEIGPVSDVICSGKSDVLSVYVFQDEVATTLNYVSVDTVSESTINITWSIQHSDRVKDKEVYLYKTVMDQNDWQLVSQQPVSNSAFADKLNSTQEYSYSYQISLTNLCEEELSSVEHNTVKLSGVANNDENLIYLTWNQYAGWLEGVDHYEIYRKLDGAHGYKKIGSISSVDHAFHITTRSGFNHYYRIRAIEKNGSGESWSNSLTFSFDHPLFVPNVFTPNGDEYNPSFQITNINLYTKTHLTVMNRWGNVVFEAHDYDNSWNANNLDSGVYYFVLAYSKGEQSFTYKGTVSIIR